MGRPTLATNVQSVLTTINAQKLSGMNSQQQQKAETLEKDMLAYKQNAGPSQTTDLCNAITAIDGNDGAFDKLTKDMSTEGAGQAVTDDLNGFLSSLKDTASQDDAKLVGVGLEADIKITP